MKWISVKDKLPKDIENMCEYDWVFVFGENEDGLKIIGIGFMRYGNWNILGNLGAYSCHSDQEEFKPEFVTHWCPYHYPSINE